MLTQSEFQIINTLMSNDSYMTQRELAESVKMSLGKVNQIVRKLMAGGYVSDDMKVTQDGVEVMQPYRVTNAIIMAAGMSSRFAPLSYDMPKALLTVKGEILIEREIRQLREAGISDVTLVVGYMKEKMFYLAEKYDVEIVVNEDYYRYNNTSTLIKVVDRLDNTYICSSDNYFAENPFEKYVYRAYYSAVYADGAIDEYCLTVDNKDRITGVSIGGENAWYMLGHVYFDRAFSENFRKILKSEYAHPQTKAELWENLYIRHIDELEMYIRRYDNSAIKEFDSLDELREFDDNYLRYSDSKIFTNICRVLECTEDEITDIKPLKTGMTNLSFHFCCKGNEYVYRHPGVGTEKYINRESEAESMKVAECLGLDDTYIYMDPVEGWKISHYIHDAAILDYHDKKQVEQALAMLKKLHDSGDRTTQDFDMYEEIEKFLDILQDTNKAEFVDMREMRNAIDKLKKYTDADGYEKCLCHCDSYAPNFLLDKNGKMYLIDWEYSGMADPGSDIGTFIACSDFDTETAVDVIEMYIGHKPDKCEKRHMLAYVAIAAFYWFVWALYQESVGKTVGEYLYIWYQYTKLYSRLALDMYEQ